MECEAAMASQAAMKGPTPADLAASPLSIDRQRLPLLPAPVAKGSRPPQNKSTSTVSQPASETQQIDQAKRIKMADKSDLTGVVIGMLLMFPAILAGLMTSGAPWYIVLALVLGPVSVPFLMVAYHYMPKTDRKAKKGQIARVKPSDISGLPAAYFCYVLGSGGHTTEMMELIRKTLRPSKNVHRRYIFTTGDRNSLVAMTSFEQRVTEVYGEDAGTWDAYQITRARKVHQPLWTTWLTSLLSALSALEALMTLPDAEIRPDPQDRKCFQYPHVITTNGPGTGIIVSLVAHLLKIFWARNCMKVVFIETWAHVRTLSLTGKLFHWTRIPDVYLVQHEPLAERYGYPLFEFVTLPRPIRPDVTGSNHASQSPHSPAIGASLLGGPAASTAVMSPEHSSCEDSSSMSPPSSPTGATCNSSVHEGSSDQG